MQDDSHSTRSRQGGWHESPRLRDDAGPGPPGPTGTCPLLAIDTAEALRVPGRGAAARYAALLLESLGLAVDFREDPRATPDPHPDVAWAASGAMALTGAADGPALLACAPVATCADGAARALRILAAAGLPRSASGARQSPELDRLDGAALLGERAALRDAPLTRRGRISPGGSARLVAGADGWLALNLAREDDRALIPAWLEGAPASGAEDGWAQVESVMATRPVDPLVARGRMMGLAVSRARLDANEDGGSSTGSWHDTRILAPPGACRREPLVVDLSALWAGPLCGQLLAACGARVVKVESHERPDAARAGDARFFDRMNGEKESVALSFRSAQGVRALRALLAAADLVIEASRPRALEQLGIDADAVVAESGGTWLSITGHGRGQPERDWVAFGDDAAAAAGLLVRTGDGTPAFCGDALADPLTGLHAAVAALAGLARGGGRRIDVSLAGVGRWVHDQRGRLEPGPRPPDAALVPVAPRARAAERRAAALGADTARVLGELGIAC